MVGEGINESPPRREGGGGLQMGLADNISGLPNQPRYSRRRYCVGPSGAPMAVTVFVLDTLNFSSRVCS